MSDVLCDGSCRHHFRSSSSRRGCASVVVAMGSTCALAKHHPPSEGRVLVMG